MRARRTRRRSVLEDPAEGTAGLAAEPDAEPDAVRTDTHVITLQGPDGWQLDHPAGCLAPGDCAVTEAAGRISQAMCATLGRWTCGVSGASLVLLERLGRRSGVV